MHTSHRLCPYRDSIDPGGIHWDTYDCDSSMFSHKHSDTVDSCHHNTASMQKDKYRWEVVDDVRNITLRLHGCFPQARIRVHLISQRNSWQQGIAFSLAPHRQRLEITCRHWWRDKVRFWKMSFLLTNSQSPAWHRCKHRWRPQFSFRSHVSPHVGTSSEQGRFSYSTQRGSCLSFCDSDENNLLLTAAATWTRS